MLPDFRDPQLVKLLYSSCAQGKYDVADQIFQVCLDNIADMSAARIVIMLRAPFMFCSKLTKWDELLEAARIELTKRGYDAEKELMGLKVNVKTTVYPR